MSASEKEGAGKWTRVYSSYEIPSNFSLQIIFLITFSPIIIGDDGSISIPGLQLMDAGVERGQVQVGGWCGAKTSATEN